MALDHEGLHEDAPSAISVIGGSRVDPLDMRVEDVNVYHVAHSLSRQCRYGGHTGGFLSVAQHSIWVANRLKTWGHDARMQLWGLMHDASEAYIGDMVKPLKHDPSMAAFVTAEHEIEKVIAEKFNLPYPMPDVVKEADRFVTVEVEIGLRLRDTHKGEYEADRHLFIAHYYNLKQELSE